MSTSAASRKTSNPGNKAAKSTYSDDDEDDKYSKVKQSKDRLFRRVFIFIAISFVITACVCHVTGTNIRKGSKLRRRFNGIAEKLKSKDSQPVMNGIHEKEGNNNGNDPLSDGVSNEKQIAGLKTKADVKVLEHKKLDWGRLELDVKVLKLKKLEERRLELDKQVRAIKATGIIMETDKKSLEVTKQLQDVTRMVIKQKYGHHQHYRVKVDLEFQSSIPDFDRNGPDGTIVIEMAPIEYIPVSVYNWLEIARTWRSGAFHRNAGHVLQATTNADAVSESMAFQEYSDKHPHKKGTVGYCGRPSGPCWYISIENNTGNHGPGSQQKKNPHEADSNFGRIVEGLDDVVPRIHSTPEKSWLKKENQILIKTMTILVPGPDDTFIEWKE